MAAPADSGAAAAAAGGGAGSGGEHHHAHGHHHHEHGHHHGAPAPEDNCLGALRLKIKPTTTPPVVEYGMHADNRARLVARLRAGGVTDAAVVVVQGGATAMRHETDHEDLFRQESNFHWLFGVAEPDCYGAVEVATGRATLFVPKLDPSYAVWMGAIRTKEAWRELYGVDAVEYVEDLPAALTRAAPSRLLLNAGKNSDSGAEAKPAAFAGRDAFATDVTPLLYTALAHCRAIKSPAELALLRYIATVSSEAHIAVMQMARPGLREYQMESVFQHWCYYIGGARYLSYTCICASGANGAILHYGHAGEPNKKQMKDGDLCLFDMGSEFHCYGSDITTTFPLNGKFTPDQKIVYEAVLDAQTSVLDALRPGASWVDMHAIAYRRILTHLKAGGVLTGDVEEMMAVNLGATFMPHGLGHFLGIDTHDVGGYPADCPDVVRPSLPGFRSLRTARTLEAGMFLTVEPGCYFIDPLLDAALADPARARFIVPAALARFRGFGGVRLEDDVAITADGCDNYTHAPRTVADVEAVMAGTITQRAELTKFH